MKNRVTAFAFLFSLLIFILSCDNDVDMPQNAAGAGYGKVAVTINGASARTVFPTMTFEKYEYLFAKVTNGTPGAPIQEAPVGGYFTLELGDWQLTVKAYVKTTDTVSAATGTSATFTVTSSGAAQVTVHLSGNAATGSGNFVYTITYPAGATINIFSLTNLQNNAVTNINASGASPLSGSRAINAGYYFLTIQLTEGGGTGRTTGANEVVYIYDKLDSAYSKTFSADDFSHIHDWNTTYTTITAATATTDGIEAITCKHNSSHTQNSRFNGEYATGTAGLSFSRNGDAYSVSRGTATGAIFLPAYRLYNGNYLPVTQISNDTDSSVNNAFGGFLDIFTGNITPQPNVISVTFAAESPLTTIGNYAFYYCTSLTSITIPASVTSIGNSAFDGCTSLTSITVNANNSNFSSEGGILYNKAKTTLIKIPEGMSGSVNIPASVTSFVSGTFSKCSNLTAITVAAGNQNYTSENGILYNKEKTMSIVAPQGISGSVTIPASVTYISNGTFAYCTSLTSVTFAPNSQLTSIGQGGISPGVFSGCSSLTSITIPAGVTTIGDYAFSLCTSLTSINIPASVTSIGRFAFGGCTSLTGITIPAGVTSLSSTFQNCTSITSIIIPAGVSLSSLMFSNWTSSQTINIRGYANQAAADSAWGTGWRENCNAVIKYWNGSSYQ